MTDARSTPESSEPLEPLEHHDPLLRHLTEWTRQVGEQPRERVAMGIAAAARGFHAQLKALPTSTRFTQSENAPIREIAAERQRQVESEGWDAEHDDAHDTGGLAQAAACYASLAALQASLRTPADIYANAEPPFSWPWDRKWWKPKNPRRDLVRSAALIVAEIERIDRRAK